MNDHVRISIEDAQSLATALQALIDMDQLIPDVTKAVDFNDTVVMPLRDRMLAAIAEARMRQ